MPEYHPNSELPGNPASGPGTPPTPSQRRRARGLRTSVATVYYVALLALSLLGLMAGMGYFGLQPRESLVGAGAVGILLALAVAPVLIQLDRLAARFVETRVSQNLDELNRNIRLLTEQASLSPDARRVLNRGVERELLCRAIEEDIAGQDWDAAMVLSAELADRFGYRAEAEVFRARIEKARAGVQERRLNDAIAQLDGLIVQRRWEQALREAASIRRLFPDSPRVEGLRDRVEQARSVYKADLERRFLEAARQNQIEDAMALLKELDTYLSEAEAEPFREVARGVITRARDNLGAQFKIAVQDRQWALAASLGRRIVAEFPNTRMANEVRQLMDSILSKANTAGAVGAVPAPGAPTVTGGGYGAATATAGA
ncbi:MAG TPA: hypothetical protein VD963_10875 [Phycisphaerales bacterium]|nr:hypothetical protein [Phycisphaerales bacterium]